MARGNAGVLIVFLIATAIGGAALYRVFWLRFEFGDVYGPYSTLRADPQGSRALYEALERMPGVAAARNTQSILRLEAGGETAYLLLGASPSPDPLPLIEHIESLVAGGMRLVVAYRPVRAMAGRGQSVVEFEGTSPESLDRWEETEEESDEAKDAARAAEDEEPGEDEEPAGEPTRSARPAQDWVERRWGFSHGAAPLPGESYDQLGSIEVTRIEERPGLPDRLRWHSARYFTNLDPEWRAIYARGAQPVVIERDWEAGSIVMLADAFLFSNEALRNARAPGLIAWLIADKPRVVFEETIHGHRVSEGIMTLARRYRLHAAIATLLLLGLLFIWRNAFSLAPPLDTGAEPEAQSGKDAGAGLVNLLRRGVPREELLAACYKEWRHAAPRTRRAPIDEGAVAPLIAVKQRPKSEDIVARYQRLAALLEERN